MRDDILRRLQALQRSFAAFTPGQKTIAVIGSLALVFAAVLVFRWAATPSYVPLFTNLAPADASAIVDKLSAAGTPYELSDGGGTVLVPQSQVYAARIKLSGEGLPSQGPAGYSLLDNQSLSTSQFQEQTTYKRAIEGELEKTIEALDPVQTAVVHVAMPQQQLFSSQQQPVTASVLVQTKPGASLDSTQVQAIVHLVASSVEGLDPKQVTVADSAGDVLSTAGTGVDSIVGTRDQQVQDFEDRMKTQVQAVLDRVIGPNNSAVDVTADLNFDQTVTNTTRYFTTPKNAVPLSGSTSKETYKGPNAAAAGGVVGPNGQLTPGTVSGGGSTSYTKEQKTADNAVSKSVEHLEAAPGNVQSLHVGIVMDAKSVGSVTAAQVQQLVASALGINPKRGDTVQVSVLPFNRTAEKQAALELAQAQAAEHKAALLSAAKTGGLILLVGLILLLAWLNGRKRRKLRDKATSYVVEQLRRNTEPEAAQLPPTPPALEMSGSDPGQLRLAARDEIAAMVERQPEEVAQLLRGWLVEADR